MTNLVKAFPMSELPVGTVKQAVINGLPVAVAHTAEGVFAIGDVCSHAEVSLSEGELNGCLLECWLHGAAFDLRTGVPATPPAVTPVPTYPVHISGDGDEAIISIEMSN